MSFSSKTKIIIIFDIIVFFLCGLGLYHNVQKAGLQADHRITFLSHNDTVIVSSIIDPHYKDYFEVGDIIQSVQGIKIHHKYDIEFVFDGINIGDKVAFEILRNGQKWDISLTAPHYYNLLYLVIQSIVSSLFLILGIITIYNRPDFDVAIIWHWASIGSAVIISCTWGNYNILPFHIGYYLRVLFFAAYTIVPVTFFHLSLIFPNRKTIHINKIIYPLYILAALLFITETFFWLNTVYVDSIKWGELLFIPFNINRVLFSITMLGGIGSIIHSYFSAEEEYQRRQVRWLMLGLTIGPPSYILFWQIPQTLGFDALIPEEFVVFILIVVPITFYIAIIKHHIFDINLFINRSTVYFFVVILLFIIYGSLVVITSLILEGSNVETSLISSIAAAILTPIFFEPARRYFRKAVDTVFFRVQYNYRLAQRQITMELDKTVDKGRVANLVIMQIDDLLQLRSYGFYLYQNEKWNLIASKDFNFEQNLVEDLHKVSSKSNKNIMASGWNIETGVKIEDLKKYDKKGFSQLLAIPFRNHQYKTLGMLILGLKKSGSKFSLEDADLFNTIAVQVALAIERIDLQQQLLFKSIETDKLKELSDLKSYFVSSVSHELQTPLTSIKMFAELLQEKKNVSPEEKEEYLEIIQGESDRLSRLINNVLDFSKIERGVKEYQFKVCDINEIISEVMQLMKYQFDQYGFKTRLKLARHSLAVKADKDALVGAFINILSNSIKYSDIEKEITLEVSDKDDRIFINFKDKGVGISREDQHKIFDTFFRSSNDKITSMGGAGLGLTLVQHIVQAHNGNIKVESEPGLGSSFLITFPLYSEKNKEAQ